MNIDRDDEKATRPVSDTPITDAAEFNDGLEWFVAAEVSKKLERDLTAARKEGEIAGMREAINAAATEICDCCWNDAEKNVRDQIIEAIDRAIQEKEK